jgi:hypothetical protein
MSINRFNNFFAIVGNFVCNFVQFHFATINVSTMAKVSTGGKAKLASESTGSTALLLTAEKLKFNYQGISAQTSWQDLRADYDFDLRSY